MPSGPAAGARGQPAAGDSHLGRTKALLAVALLAASVPAAADGRDAGTPGGPAAAPPARIAVNAGAPAGPVNRKLFGHNVEAADPYLIFSAEHRYVQPRTADGLWDPGRRAPVPEALGFARNVGMGMLRYPGGCLVHGFDWRAAAGPVESRPNFAFGLDEFIAFCRAAGAEPLVNVSDYAASPADAGNLVEYLNGPADPGHPWARKRAAAGHREPYGVRYFELGNESDHGNHDAKPFRKFTAREYAEWFNECARRMRSADRGVKLGALMGTGTGPRDPWNAAVLEGVRGRADFIVVHTYAVGIWSPDSAVREPADVLMRACMAAGGQFEIQLAEYRDLIRKHSGRDLPLAITEYNAMFVQEKPVPYRFSYGPALFSADYLRILLKPESNVLMANYWHFINGYWGMIRGPRLPEDEPRSWSKMPAYHLYRLWGSHFGDRLVPVEVESPALEFEGLPGRVLPARGDRYAPVRPVSGNLVRNYRAADGTGYRIREKDGVLTVELTDYEGESYPFLAEARGPAGNDYRMSFEARSKGDFQDARLGLSLLDARGWDETRSGIGVEGIEGAGEWRKFEGALPSLPDCPGTQVAWRLLSPKARITGKMEIRKLEVTSISKETCPAYPALTAAASLSEDGRKLFLVVFNKHHAQNIEAAIGIAGFPARSTRRWTVTGPSLEASNLDDERVRETESGVEMEAGGGARHVFPARSMTAIEYSRE